MAVVAQLRQRFCKPQVECSGSSASFRPPLLCNLVTVASIKQVGTKKGCASDGAQTRHQSFLVILDSISSYAARTTSDTDPCLVVT